MTQSLLPLEVVFERKATVDKSSFPRVNDDYITLYKGIVGYLRKEIYPKIDVGLAANSETTGIYTFHDGDHFDEVVRFAGYLLGIKNGSEDVDLSAYELYLLLVAIRIHDVGNIEGRKDHEKRCFERLRDMQTVAGTDVSEKRMIANIAQAHGGTTPGGDKDTLGNLQSSQEIAGGKVRHRLLASILRFADEACDSRARALRNAQIPEQNQIYHAYSNSIGQNQYLLDEKRLVMIYEIPMTDVGKLWGKEDKKVHLVDYILSRLTKMDQERRYCNKYSRNIYTVDEIRATILIVDELHETVVEFAVPILKDAGYPDDDPNRLSETLKHICGEGLENTIKEQEGKK